MPRIAISYRREDSAAITGRIFDRLTAQYGGDSVFRDIDNIPLGVDFREHIDAMLAETDITLVIIGKRWLGPGRGRRRINDPADPVRIEVETALRIGKPVIPILVEGSGMPKVDQLPDTLKDLIYRNGLDVDSGRDFDQHVERLIRNIDPILARISRQRAEEEKRRAEAARQAEEEKQRAEAARQAEEEKQRAEAARQAEEEKQRAEAARQAQEERQRGEAARLAEDGRQRAEAARQAEEERQGIDAARQAEMERQRMEALRQEAARQKAWEKQRAEAARRSEEERLQAEAARRTEGTRRREAFETAQRDQNLRDFVVFKDAPFAPELVALPPGEFCMGSLEEEEGRHNNEGPRHLVTIGGRFAIGRYPVTFDEYDRFCEARKRRKPPDQGWGRGRRPVVNVSWNDARAYLEWLSEETGKPYRLPTESEWEYACRAGTATRYSFGEAISPKDANFFGGGTGSTSEIGAYPANPWGLYDFHGNVWEWVEDDWHDDYQGAPDDGSAWKDKDLDSRSCYIVRRGGSCYFNPSNCRSAYRNKIWPHDKHDDFGFRVARPLS
jgi:formylglycine-generating enzyme required for sulfatase activity